MALLLVLLLVLQALGGERCTVDAARPSAHAQLPRRQGAAAPLPTAAAAATRLQN